MRTWATANGCRAVLGLLILAVVGLVPFAGGLVLMVALAFGLGGAAGQA